MTGRLNAGEAGTVAVLRGKIEWFCDDIGNVAGW